MQHKIFEETLGLFKETWRHLHAQLIALWLHRTEISWARGGEARRGMKNTTGWRERS